MMQKAFFEIPCLSEHSRKLSVSELYECWEKKFDKRNIAQYVQRFIAINSASFDFIGVTPCVSGYEQDIGISFKSSSFIGSVPLISPATGKQSGDFVVKPKFIGQDSFSEYSNLLDLMEEETLIEFLNDGLYLSSGHNYRPPLYLEAIKFIESIEALLKTNWLKFNSIQIESNQPDGNVDWNRYINSLHKVDKQLSFLVNKNVLSKDHPEFRQVRYVYDVCKNEIFSVRTPVEVKRTFVSRCAIIDEKLYWIRPQPTDSLRIRVYDPNPVNNCKVIANRVLNFNISNCPGWRIDFSLVFERFVQFVFLQLKKEIGGRLINNPKFYHTKRSNLSWSLKYLEPDLLFEYEETMYFIDAKYKSNLYNINSASLDLKEDHRRDLHQILAYSSFGNSKNKCVFLCYPSNAFIFNELTYSNQTNSVSNKIIILGIPLKKELVPETVQNLKGKFLSGLLD